MFAAVRLNCQWWPWFERVIEPLCSSYYVEFGVRRQVAERAQVSSCDMIQLVAALTHFSVECRAYIRGN